MVLGANEMSEGKGVNLLTVGLEFKEVYIVDMMEGRFPNIKLSKSAGGIEEDAKKDRIKNIQYQPSRFLAEAGYNVG